MRGVYLLGLLNEIADNKSRPLPLTTYHVLTSILCVISLFYCTTFCYVLKYISLALITNNELMM